jgi:hypothetical protein
MQAHLQTVKFFLLLSNQNQQAMEISCQAWMTKAFIVGALNQVFVKVNPVLANECNWHTHPFTSI